MEFLRVYQEPNNGGIKKKEPRLERVLDFCLYIFLIYIQFNQIPIGILTKNLCKSTFRVRFFKYFDPVSLQPCQGSIVIIHPQGKMTFPA